MSKLKNLFLNFVGLFKKRFIVYVPVEYPTKNGKPAQFPPKNYCFHDKRIGWVERRTFKNYSEYVKYLKNEAKPLGLEVGGK